MTAQERKLRVYHQFRVLSENLEERHDDLSASQVSALEEKVKECWGVVERRRQR